MIFRVFNRSNPIAIYQATRTFSSKPPFKTGASGSQATTSAKKPTADASAKTDVPGLSSKVVLARSQPLGPGASATSTYKVPEYFCYDRMSFAEAEVELNKFRLPQPSAVK